MVYLNVPWQAMVYEICTIKLCYNHIGGFRAPNNTSVLVAMVTTAYILLIICIANIMLTDLVFLLYSKLCQCNQRRLITVIVAADK